MGVPFFARRFVAGESLSQASEVVRELNHLGLQTSLDILGEDVADEREARKFLGDYIEIVDAIANGGLRSHISIKLSMLGMRLSDELATELLTTLVGRAQAKGVFIRIDMEGSDVTERTLKIFSSVRSQFDHVGVVLQCYLHRTREDLRRVLDLGGRVRLVKGAYKESPKIAFQDMATIRREFVACAEVLLDRAEYPAFATHDDSLIASVREMAQQRGRKLDTFEFQMLYGLRRGSWLTLAQQGHPMRVYVPYGTLWFPYFSRRLRERKENVLFLLKNLFRN